MARAFSEDLRERALLLADRGETSRAIAALLHISPSCVSKWRKLRRETSALTPDKMGGHKKVTLSGPMPRGYARASLPARSPCVA